MSSEKIVDIYKSLIGIAAMKADDDGFVSTQLGNSEKSPTLVKGKRLVLPTKDQQRLSGSGNSVIFHPLQENTVRGESDVMAVFRNHVNKNLNFVTAYIAVSLLDLAISTDSHPKLSPEQSEFLSFVKDADEKTFTSFQQIMEKIMVGSAEDSFIHTYIRKGGTCGGKKYSRVCVTSFPFYENLNKVEEDKKPKAISNVRLRKADIAALNGLIKYLFPDINQPEAYFGASNSSVAPSLDVIVKATTPIYNRFNEICKLFSNVIEGIDQVIIDTTYQESFKDLDQLYYEVQKIPMQEGNEGTLPNQTTTAKEIVVDEKPIISAPKIENSPYISEAAKNLANNPAPTQPVVSQQVTQPVTQPVQAAIQPPPFNPPYQTMYPGQPPVYTPAPQMYGNPYQQQYQQPMMQQNHNQQFKPAVGANGVDVASFFASNPAIAMRAQQEIGMMMPIQAPTMVMQAPQQRTPGWMASPGNFGGGYNSY